MTPKSRPGKSYVYTSTIVKKLEPELSTTIWSGLSADGGRDARRFGIFPPKARFRSSSPDRASGATYMSVPTKNPARVSRWSGAASVSAAIPKSSSFT